MPLLSTFGAASARGFGLFTNVIKFISLYSLRFNPGSSDQLSRTPTVEGNRRTWTYSLWVKRGLHSAENFLLDTTTGGNDKRLSILFQSDDTLRISDDQGASFVDLRITTQLFRDYSAWYHIVVVLDTTQATANDRLKIYVNGSQVTSFSTINNPSQNAQLLINDNIEHSIGRGLPDRAYLSAYLSQIYLIDGQALTPSSFGETDTESGIWIPKTYTGTYGTNGFFLEFENSASLGTDSSGNGNNWTVNNLTSIDQTTDDPINNFATFNPLVNNGTMGTISNGNLTLTDGDDGIPLSTIEVPKIGKWYCEIKIVSVSGALENDNIRIGISTYENSDNLDALYLNSGEKRLNNVDTSYGSSYTAGDIIGIAVNSDGNEITFYKNGVSQGAISYTMQADQTYFFTAIDGSSTVSIVRDGNFGNPPFAIVSGNSDANGFGNFEYAVPSGYYALCTKNLSEYA